MSTLSTSPERARSRWLVPIVLPVVGAVILGLGGGAAFYFFVEQRRPPVHHVPSAAAARRVSTSHVLVELQGSDDGSAAFALVGRTREGPKLLNIPASIVLEVPGIGPRTAALALRESGPDGAAVAVANALRITVPAALSGTASTVAATVDAAGGADVEVPKQLRARVDGVLQTLFAAGSAHMSGDSFVRYQTGSFVGENDRDREVRLQAGWKGFLAAVTKPAARQSLRAWTSDADIGVASGLLREAAQAASLEVPITDIGLVGEHLVRIDEGRLPLLRQSLADFTNGAENLDGRRVRLQVAAAGPLGPAVGRLLVNAGYVVVFSGKATKPSDTTRIDVSASVPGAEAEARGIAKLLGTGSVTVSTDQTIAADIMLVVGMDWASTNGFPQH